MTGPAAADSAQSLGRRLARLSQRHPDRPAVIVADVRTDKVEEVTWAELDRDTGAIARALDATAHGPAAWLPIGNSLPDIVTLLGALRAGLTVAAVNTAAPESERLRSVGAVRTAFGEVVPLTTLLGRVDPGRGPVGVDGGNGVDERPGGGWILLTGGSTGTPKAVRSRRPPCWHPERGAPLLMRAAGWRPGQVQLVLGPLHHAAPFTCFLDGVLSGNTVVLTNGYYPELLFQLVERFEVEWMQLAPVHMTMAEPLLARPASRSLAALRAVLHTSAPCPARTKQAWIRALGPEKVFETYAATEGIGLTLCDGTEWLARPGTVGRGFLTRIRIVDAEGREVPAGRTGEVWMRGFDGPGASAPTRRGGGFHSVGDHGRLDAEGYLFLHGRADDLVIVGGENVYLGEVEAALLRSAEVVDAVVRAVEDDVYGVRLVADVVLRRESTADAAALKRHCREQLPEYKRPKDFRIVPEVARNAAGKLVRAGLPPTPAANKEIST